MLLKATLKSVCVQKSVIKHIIIICITWIKIWGTLYKLWKFLSIAEANARSQKTGFQNPNSNFLLDYELNFYVRGFLY